MHKTCKSVNQFWIHKGVARNAELKQQKEEEKERRKQEREQKKLKNEREKELKGEKSCTKVISFLIGYTLAQIHTV